MKTALYPSLVEGAKEIHEDFFDAKKDWYRDNIGFSEMQLRCADLKTRLKKLISNPELDWEDSGEEIDELRNLVGGLELQLAHYLQH